MWERLGDVPNYIEPFFGTGAVLLARPTEPKQETVNDKDGLLSNCWRSIQSHPEETAHYADWPINECLPAVLGRVRVGDPRRLRESGDWTGHGE